MNEALRIDRENGNALWQDAIQKGMVHAQPAFKEWSGNIDGINIKDSNK